jgi:type I restriction enzyme, S subunit
MSFARYETYRESGIDWLGPVPAHWDVLKVKRIASLQSGDAIPAEKIEDEGEYPVLGGNGLRGYTSAYTHEGHYPVIGRQGALCGNINYGVGRFWASEHAVVATPVRPVSIVWLGEMLRAMNMNRYSLSAAQPGLSVELVSNLRTVLPPIEEQNRIASFLSKETEKIDVLVAEQQRLIKLLTEKRQAVVSHAVTKGIDAAAPMVSSNVPWLGAFPAHWRVVGSRRLFALRNEAARSDDRQLTASQKHGVIYQDDFMQREGQRVVQVIKGADILKHVEPNDFVISMRSFQGGIEWCQLRGCTSSAYVILIPSERVHGRFFSYLFKSSTYIQALQTTSNLVRDGQALRYENFAQVELPLLPLGEQAAIAAWLDRVTFDIDALIAEAAKVIALLSERRVALISAVVTGKIDVRNLVDAEAVAA